MCSSNFAFEELVLRSLRASPLMKPFLTPGGWQESKCVYWKVRFKVRAHTKNRVLIGCPCIHMYPRMLFQYLKSQPWISLWDGSYLLAPWSCLLPLCLCSIEKRCRQCIFSKWVVCLLWLWLMISVSTSAIKMLAKDTAVFVPIAVPWVFPVEMEKILLQGKS